MKPASRSRSCATTTAGARSTPPCVTRRSMKLLRSWTTTRPAIAAGLIMLIVLVANIFGKGTGAFQQSFITLQVELLESKLDKKGNRDLDEIKKVTTFGYSPLITRAFEDAVKAAGIDSGLKSKDMAGLLSKSAAADLREYVIAHPDQIGQIVLTLGTNGN